MDIPQIFLTTYFLKDIWVISRLWIKVLWTTMYRFFCCHNFHFSGINAQDITIAWSYGSCMFSFLKETAKLFSVAAVLLHLPTSNVWLIQFSCIFASCVLRILTAMFENILYILDTSLLSDRWFAIIFSQSVICLFILSCKSLSQGKSF